MSDKDKLNIGAVHIHKEVLAEIIVKTIKDIDGISLVKRALVYKLLAIFRKKDYSGVDIKVDDNNEISLNLKICVCYGMNIPDAARKLQDLVKVDLEKSTDVHLRDININVQGIEGRAK